jgi:hypothetical protein
MQTWTATDIAERFEEAVRTLRRLPPVKIRGYFNTWPPIIRTAQELMEAEPALLRLGPPTSVAIARMEETIDWIFLLDTEDERRVIWLRAEKVRWRKICIRLGCERTKAWELWKAALLKIATRLNR